MKELTNEIHSSNIDLYSEVRNVDLDLTKSNIDAEAIVNGDWEQTLELLETLLKMLYRLSRKTNRD